MDLFEDKKLEDSCQSQDDNHPNSSNRWEGDGRSNDNDPRSQNDTEPSHLNEYIEAPKPKLCTWNSGALGGPRPYSDFSQVDRKKDIKIQAQPPPRWDFTKAISAASVRFANQEQEHRTSVASLSPGVSGMSNPATSVSNTPLDPKSSLPLCEACSGRGLVSCAEDNVDLYCGAYPPCQSCENQNHNFCDARAPEKGCYRYPVCLECNVRGRNFCHWASEYKSPDCERSIRSSSTMNRKGRVAYNLFIGH
ncbi:hypothetical protein CC80DRAFT_314046 [Byssothecium circinans]|uniref:Uncharacterized protein n=1 Tax=Byssothecium circinans TaxID=147558 RepID=A0A6A5UFU2_9PLEO|nr:hypothetical protein CC80DRAFT_314046 [Byssothecium circinans]